PAECLVPGRAGVMAPLAQRAEILSRVVPRVAVDVVDDFCRRDLSSLGAEPAERLLEEHPRPDPPPHRPVPALRRRAPRRVLPSAMLGEVWLTVGSALRDERGTPGPGARAGWLTRHVSPPDTQMAPARRRRSVLRPQIRSRRS